MFEFLKFYTDRLYLLTNETDMFDNIEELTVGMSQRSLKTFDLCGRKTSIAVESELGEAMGSFYRAHDDYHRSLTRVEAQEESVSYFTEQLKRYLDFKKRTDLFRHRCERISLNEFDIVQPSDSIRQIGSKVREGRVHPSQTSSVTGCSRVSSCSRSAKASFVFSEIVKLTAEKAAMVAEVSLLQGRGSLAQERLR